MRGLCVQALTWVFLTSQVFAQSDPVTTARRASQMLDEAATALADADKSTNRIAALTQTVRAYEEGLAALREGLRRAAIRERSIALVFEAKRDNLSQLLGVLQTIGRSPAPLLMMHPSGPLGTARSGMILSDVTPALQAEAEVLRVQLEELAMLQELQESAAKTLRTALAGAQTARSSLAQAMADRTDLPRSFTADPDQMRALIESSDTLQGFADGLASLDVAETANLADFETTKGKLPIPVSGTLLRGYDEPDASGLSRPGLLWAARPGSLVTAPWPGTIRYVGPLLDYGNVMIMEPGQGYLVILAGLDKAFGEVGEIVNKGAAVGLMGGLLPNSTSFLTDAAKGSGGNLQESLYIEIRHNSNPVDPTAWFALNRE